MSFGGENSFVWGTGISLKMGSVIFDVSGGQLVVYLMSYWNAIWIWIKNPKVKIYFGA